jgi:hypothetical protein
MDRTFGARRRKLGTVRKAQAEEDTEKKKRKENLNRLILIDDGFTKSIRERMNFSTSAEAKRGKENAKN